MAGILNVGGLEGFGPIPEAGRDRAWGRADWEAHLLAVVRVLMSRGVLTESRLVRAIRRRSGGPPEEAGYELWVDALGDLLVEGGVLSPTDPAVGGLEAEGGDA